MNGIILSKTDSDYHFTFKDGKCCGVNTYSGNVKIKGDQITDEVTEKLSEMCHVNFLKQINQDYQDLSVIQKIQSHFNHVFYNTSGKIYEIGYAYMVLGIVVA